MFDRYIGTSGIRFDDIKATMEKADSELKDKKEEMETQSPKPKMNIHNNAIKSTRDDEYDEERRVKQNEGSSSLARKVRQVAEEERV